MTVQTGRTLPDFWELYIGAAGGTMYGMKINDLGDLGFDYEKKDMSAWVDGVKGYLVGKPDFELSFGGPIDNTATSGPSTLLRSWIVNQTLLSFDVRLGERHVWEAGEQQFGLSAVVASNSGVHVIEYKDKSTGMYAAKICMFPGSAVVPDWGIAVEVVPA